MTGRGAVATLARVADLDPRGAAEATRAARTPFQTPAYAAAFVEAGADARLLLASDASGEPLGHALLVEESAFGFRRWSGLSEPALREGASARAFWDALVAAGRARGAVSASWRDLTATRLDAPDVEAAQAACAAAGGASAVGRFGASLLDLTRPADALWDGMHRKHRNAARRAESGGVVAGPCAPDAFAQAHAPLSDATWRRSGGAGPPRAYFERLAREPWALPYVARDARGRSVASALATLREGAATYLHGASADEGAPGASTLLQWTIVRDLQARGARAYDLGGSPLEGAPDDTPRQAGIRRFKERFGGEARAWAALHLQLDPAAYEKARAAAREAHGRIASAVSSTVQTA